MDLPDIVNIKKTQYNMSRANNSPCLKYHSGFVNVSDYVILLSVCLWIWGASTTLVAQHQKNHPVWSLEGTGRNKASGRETEKETKMEGER